MPKHAEMRYRGSLDFQYTVYKDITASNYGRKVVGLASKVGEVWGVYWTARDPLMCCDGTKLSCLVMAMEKLFQNIQS